MNDAMAEAPCRSNPDAFFTDNPAAAVVVARHCDGCPIRRSCREWGIRHELYGIWGGATAAERKAIRRRRGITLEVPRTEDFTPRQRTAA